MKKYIILSIVSLLAMTLIIGGCAKINSDSNSSNPNVNSNESSKMTVDEARNIAQKLCKEGTLKDSWFYNSNSETYWFDMNLKKEGCTPACVVYVLNQSAEINWRCTGLILPAPPSDNSSSLTDSYLTEDQSIKLAQEFIQKSSTYVFDGSELKYVGNEGLLITCPGCYHLVFEFTSSHGGYGNRSGMMIIEVITPHKVIINMNNKRISSAEIDTKWDMITDKELPSTP